MRWSRGLGGARTAFLAQVGTAVSLALLLGACAPRRQNPPPTTSVSSVGVGFQASDAATTLDLRHQADVGETTVPASVTSVWGVLPEVFDQLEIDLTFVDASSGAMGNGGFRARRVEGERMSRWLDCGRDLIQATADVYDVTLSVLVQLLVVGENATTVRTTIDAYARGRGGSGGRVHCVSWGTLERRIPELVMARLGG